MTPLAEPTQLVVALPHLGLLLSALDEARESSGDSAGPLYADPLCSDPLGLALVTLPEPERAAQALPGTATADALLDQILARLRAGFQSRYFGWTPHFGKNRMVGKVTGPQQPAGVSEVAGAGEVSHGGGGAPTAIAKPSWAAGPGVTTLTGVTVGLVDTAMAGHEYLTGCWTGPYQSGRMVNAEDGHATFIAGLIRRHAPGVTLRVHPALDDAGDADSWSVAHRILEAGRAGVDVLNLSFVCYTGDGVGPMVLATALERLPAGTVVVAAAGNHGYLGDRQEFRPAFPAAFPGVIAVGAEGASFSAKGPWINVQAPGTDLESTFLSGPVAVWADPDGPGPAPAARQEKTFQGYARWSGTSFAAGLVSAEIARRTEPGRRTATEAAADLLGQRNARDQSRPWATSPDSYAKMTA